MDLNYNTKLNEIDNSIKSFKDIELSKHNFFDLIFLLELKISKVLNEEDVRSFASLTQELELSEEDKKTLRFLRNTIVHGFISEEKLISYKPWINETIIPAILKFQPKIETEIFKSYPRFDDSEFLNKIISIAKSMDFEIKWEFEITVYRKFRLVPDLVFKRGNKFVMIEIKEKFSNSIMKLGVQRLKEFLGAAKTKWGVLVFLEPIKIINKKVLTIKKKKLNIKIIGPKIDVKEFKNWLKKIK